MRPLWCVWLLVSAVLCWATLRPAGAWGADLERALSHSRTVVVLVAAPDRPLSSSTRRAIDAAWSELRPRAERVVLDRAPARLGCTSALSLCVFTASGELVARRDGALDAAIAEEWLRSALDAAASETEPGTSARSDPRLLFAHAERALHLGVLDRAEVEFSKLAADPAVEWQLAAHERLARISVDNGDLERAREQAELAGGTSGTAATCARLLLTRGLIEFGERHNCAARATLAEAVTALVAARDDEADRARFELARAQAASGEESCAIDLLDELARTSSTCAQREAARRLAAELCSPPLAQ